MPSNPPATLFLLIWSETCAKMDVHARQGTRFLSMLRFSCFPDDDDDNDDDDDDNDDDGVVFPRWFSQGHDSCQDGLKNLMA